MLPQWQADFKGCEDLIRFFIAFLIASSPVRRQQMLKQWGTKQKTIAPHPGVPWGDTPSIFTMLHLQVPPKPQTKFQVNPTIGSEDAQSGFRGDAQPRGPRGTHPPFEHT